VVRPARESDVDAIRQIYGVMVTDTATSFEEEVPTREEMARRMTAAPRLPWFVVEAAQRVVAFAYASQHRQRAAYRWSADCSVYVSEAHLRQGVGRLLYERLIPEVRSLGYVTLFAGIALPNAASIRLHERFNFQPVGVFRSVGFKKGQWRDVGWWALQLSTPPAEPEAPREWGA
jgi:phosphinothricin acetyltransferase